MPSTLAPNLHSASKAEAMALLGLFFTSHFCGIDRTLRASEACRFRCETINIVSQIFKPGTGEAFQVSAVLHASRLVSMR
jgi:hypothetical protein